MYTHDICSTVILSFADIFVYKVFTILHRSRLKVPYSLLKDLYTEIGQPISHSINTCIATATKQYRGIIIINTLKVIVMCAKLL